MIAAAWERAVASGLPSIIEVQIDPEAITGATLGPIQLHVVSLTECILGVLTATTTLTKLRETALGLSTKELI